MKIALYIEDGLEQIVLTPETDTERGILGKLTDDSRELSIRTGSFYECRGGWVRHRQQGSSLYGVEPPKDDSTMIVLREKPPLSDRTAPADDREDGQDGQHKMTPESSQSVKP